MWILRCSCRHLVSNIRDYLKTQAAPGGYLVHVSLLVLRYIYKWPLDAQQIFLTLDHSCVWVYANQQAHDTLLLLFFVFFFSSIVILSSDVRNTDLCYLRQTTMSVTYTCPCAVAYCMCVLGKVHEHTRLTDFCPFAPSVCHLLESLVPWRLCPSRLRLWSSYHA